MLFNIREIYFYMGNAQIHQNKTLYPLLSRINIFYGLTYSEIVDMIKEYFGLIKQYIRKSGWRTRY